tara:strand:+ start:697 stop:870 length:174 start_codon:yes stop_codon:yes gene_type:complete
MMANPINPVKNTRKAYYRHLEEVVTEVEVQFSGEPSTWIPYTTLMAIQDYYGTLPRD